MLVPTFRQRLPNYCSRSFRQLLPSTLIFTSLAFIQHTAGPRWRTSHCSTLFHSPNFLQSIPRRVSNILACQASSKSDEGTGGFRVNKCFAAFASRREADKFVTKGRVKINDILAEPGMRVKPGDKVCSEPEFPNQTFLPAYVLKRRKARYKYNNCLFNCWIQVYLDGKLVQWEAYVTPAIDATVHGTKQTDNGVGSGQRVYIKYWKPQGVVCTTDRSIDGNIIDAVNFPKRLFPVGRLDKDSTGLILLTNDGRVPNALLRAAHQHGKFYMVSVNKPISDKDLLMLRNGVIITTPVQRDRVDKLITAKTLACQVERIDLKRFRITLYEGRNRQIRKMCESLGYEVVDLHREKVVSIGLKGIKEGEWRHLDEQEVDVIRMAVQEEQERLASTDKEESSGQLEDDEDSWEEDRSGGITRIGKSAN